MNVHKKYCIPKQCIARNPLNVLYLKTSEKLNQGDHDRLHAQEFPLMSLELIPLRDRFGIQRKFFDLHIGKKFFLTV